MGYSWYKSIENNNTLYNIGLEIQLKKPARF